jgi:MFS family permease
VETTGRAPATAKRRALRFVVLIGIVSLFADVTYEGARGGAGPFLGLLGASGAVVGAVAGLGESLGYGLRFVSGRVADRTRSYWPIVFIGYTVNLLAVPALALAGNWPVAAGLLLLERTGKAIRNPARDAMLSHAAHEVGHGWAFGLHEALDQVGAVVGPLAIAAAVALRPGVSGYQTGFAFLLVPAMLALVTLALARRYNRHPRELEPAAPQIAGRGFGRDYALYVTGGALLAAGFVDFPLLALHLEQSHALGDSSIVLLYALANAVGAVAGLALGKAFDVWGPRVVPFAAAVSILSAPLVLLGSTPAILLGVALWGVGIGVQGSVFKSVIAQLVPANRRGAAFGTYGAVFGIAWLAGSVPMGILYDHSLLAVGIVSATLQAAAIPFIAAVTMKRAASK